MERQEKAPKVNFGARCRYLQAEARETAGTSQFPLAVIGRKKKGPDANAGPLFLFGFSRSGANQNFLDTSMYTNRPRMS